MSVQSQETVSVAPSTTPSTSTTTTASSGRGNQAAVSAAGLDGTTAAGDSASAGTTAGLETLGEDAGAVLDAMPLATALEQALPNQHIAAVAEWVRNVDPSAVVGDALTALFNWLWPVGMSVSIDAEFEVAVGVDIVTTYGGTVSFTGEGFEITASGSIAGGLGFGIGEEISGAATIPIEGAAAGVGVSSDRTGELMWSVPLTQIAADVARAGLQDGTIVAAAQAIVAMIETRDPDKATFGGGVQADGEAKAGGLGFGGAAEAASGISGTVGYDTNPDTGETEWVATISAEHTESAVLGLIAGVEEVIAALGTGFTVEVHAPMMVLGIPDLTAVYFVIRVQSSNADCGIEDGRRCEDLTDVLALLASAAIAEIGIETAIDADSVTPLQREVTVKIEDASAVLGATEDAIVEAAGYLPGAMVIDQSVSRTFAATLEVGKEAVAAADPGTPVLGGAVGLQQAIADACAPALADDDSPVIDPANLEAGLAASTVQDASFTYGITIAGAAGGEIGTVIKTEVSAQASATYEQKIELTIADGTTLAAIATTASLSQPGVTVTDAPTPEIPTEEAGSETAPDTTEAATAEGATETSPETETETATETEPATATTPTTEPSSSTSTSASSAESSGFSSAPGSSFTRPASSRFHRPVRPGPFGRRFQEGA